MLNYTSYQVLKRLFFEHIIPYSKLMLLAIFFMVIVAICSALIVKLVEPTINEIFLTHNKKMLIVLPLKILIIYTLKGLAEYYQTYFIKYVGQKILTNLQMKMYEHLIFSDLSFIYSQSSGRLISRFTNDISLMRGAVSNLLVGCAKHLLTVVFLIILMFQLEPMLSCLVFIVFPIAMYPIQRLGQKMRTVSSQIQEELGHYTSRLDETFQSLKIIKSFSSEKIEVNRAKLIIKNILNLYKKAAKLDALASPIMETLCGLAAAGIVWYGGSLIIKGETTAGALLAFISAFVTTYRPFKSLLSLNINLQEGIAAAKRVFFVLDTEPLIRDDMNVKEVNLSNPLIEFKGVFLKFGRKTALKGVDINLENNKTIAIVGRSGSGKTSLMNLLVRFYDFKDGEILINGYNIRKISINSLRKQVSIVTQDVVLFDSTIKDNILYGNYNSSLEDVHKVAQLADAHEFISKFPEGYNTIIGSQGVTLSGGQQQRISIARALLKNGPILILDEATSALDLNAELTIINTLKSLRKDKIIIIITHRLSSITWVDKIVVMNNGIIVEQGKHEELINNKSEYYKLYNREF